MSMYGSQKGINSNRKGSGRSDVTGGGNYQYTRSEAGQGGGNGYGVADPFMDAYSYTFSSGGGAGGSGQGCTGLHQKAMILQEQCQEFLRKAEHAMQTGGDVECYMAMARETIDQLKGCASQLRQIGQPNDNVVRSVEVCRDQLKGVHMAISGSLQRRRKSTRGNSGAWEDPGRTYVDAMAWIGQQKRLIETSPWGDDQETLQQQQVKHQKFHSFIQRSDEVDRARDELHQNGDKASLNALDQEWDSLQKMSFSRSEWLQELQLIIEDISKEIMWVNYKEEEELVFDWGDKNIDLYIPKKQESYSQLMSALEEKEKDLNRLKVKVGVALKNNHPASDKIEAYMDTLQTQWSWLLQITKCIHVHLKENAAYSQFFKEANETYGALQKEHETIRKKFTCDKDTSLDSLLALHADLEKEKEKILENKRHVQHLVNTSKSIVRLKPRNTEEKSSNTVIVRALCDFKQDQKVICKDNEGILKDNSHRSKWQVTGPGGLDMLVPSVCLLVPPPNPISISMAKKNDQYYEAILSIWNQLYINIKSLISWQYCRMDIENINSLTIAMLSQMSSEEYRSLIKRLENHYAEFRVNSHGSQMIEEEDLMTIESQYNGAQNHYEQLVVQLPSYIQYASTDYAVQLQNIEPQKVEPKWQLVHQPMYFIQQPSQQVVIQEEQEIRMERVREVEEEEERRRVEIRRLEEKRRAEVEARKREEALKLEEEMRKREEANRWEEERRRTEEAARKREEAMKLEQEKRRMEETQRLEEEVRLREEKRKMEEAKRKVEVKKVEVKKDHVIKKEAVRTTKAESVKKKTMSSSSSSSSFHGSSSRSLMELHTLRTRMESAEGALNQHIHISLGDDKVRECGLRITELETLQRDIDDIQGDILRIKDMISMEIEGMADADKAQFLRSDIGGITQRLSLLDSSLSAYLQRLRALRNLLESVSHGEDLVKVHEARLTEKDTTSLSAGEVEDYIMYLKNMRVQLDQKRDVFDSMEAEMEKVNNCNSQLGDSSLRCDMTLATYSELVGQLTSRWRRIHTQIDCRIKDLEFYVPQLQQYKKDSTSLDEWINSTQKRQKALQSTKIEDLETVVLHISQQKALNSEIKEKRRTLDSVLTESGDCVSSIRDYESDLAAYGSGLETLLNIPIKRTILTSPSTELNQEAVEMQTRYMELFTLSGDYYTYLGAMQKNMEELKIRNTRIDLLEEELRLLKGSIESHTTKNRELQDALARYRLELSNSKDQLLSVENGNEDESRKRRLAEDRYNKQKEEYENLLRRAEKNMTDKEREAEQLRKRLADESARVRELQLETSKTTDDLERIKLSLESECHIKQRLQEENDRLKNEFRFLKDKYDSKESQTRQYDSDKDRFEQEINDLKGEIQRLRKDSEVIISRKTMAPELKAVREPPNLIFDGVRKTVTAKQLHDCGVLDEITFNKLLEGKKRVPAVSVDKKVILKGTGPIAGVVIASPKGTFSLSGPLSKMSLSEAKKGNLLPLDCADLLLDAQAATGHMIDPRLNQKLTVEEACDQGLVDENDRQRLLAAEAAAVGYHDPGTGKPLSAFQAMKKGLIDQSTALRLLQAQECTGGILDPTLSVFLPKDLAMERDLINEDMYWTLNQRPDLYMDPETELGASYISLKRRCLKEPNTGLLLLPVSKKLDPSKLVFDGVRKPVTAKQLNDCGVLDKPLLDQLLKGEISVQDVSVDKKIILKGTGPIAGVVIASAKGTVSLSGPLSKMSLSEAKEKDLLPLDCADLLLDAQAATGHMIDPITNQKLTVEEACDQGLVDENDRQRLLAAEAAAVGYHDPGTGKPLSAFQAMKKGLIDKNTALRLIQAQESTGGILDPILSVFLPKDIAYERDLINEQMDEALNQRSALYMDPTTEQGASYGSIKRRCKTEPNTGLLLLPVPQRLDPSNLVFDGVRKPVTAKQLLDCGVIDKPTLKELCTGKKTVSEVSTEKVVSLKGNGPIAAVIVGNQVKMSFAEAKKQGLVPPECANMLLEAQAATGHIIDSRTNQNLTVEEACDKGVVAREDRDRLLAAEAAAIGYYDRRTAKHLSVFEAMKKGIVDKKTALTLLQAQESAGGILDPVKSVFLPKDTAIKHQLLDEELKHALNQQPEYYIDPETEMGVPYEVLRKRCKTESHTGLILLPISGKQDPNKLIFDGVRKPVTAQQLLDCGVLDKPTFNQLLTKEKTIPDVSKDKKISLKGTGAIAAVIAGDRGKMSFAEAKKQGLIPIDSANKLLEAQAATGHIIDPETNKKLTVVEACEKGVVANEDRERLLAAESAAIGYTDRSTAKPLSVFEALKRGIVDKKTALTLLQAQESAGGILDPVNSVFLPKDAAMKGKLIDEEIKRSLNQQPECYIDPDTEKDVTYESLKRKCKIEYDTGLLLLPISGKQDPNKLIFDGVRKPVTAQQLLDCGVLDKPTFNQLLTEEKTIPEVSKDKKISLKGTGAIAAVIAGDHGKMSFAEAKKQGLIPTDSANKLLEAQAATGHIIDPETNTKLTVEEACIKGVVAKEDRERLLAAESAAIGYPDRTTAKPLSVFEALKKGIVDKKTALTLLQAQESAGGILDPVNSVFLPKDAAMKGKLIDEEIKRSLNQQPECYIDPDTEKDVTYESLKRRCKTEYDTGLLLLPISGKQDPNKLIFDGVRKPVTAQQLLDCGVLDKPTFNQLLTKEKTIQDVSKDKKISLKGTGAIAAVIAGDRGKMSFAEAKKQGLIPIDSANKLLEAQAATGHIIDPETNKKLTVEEACIKGVVAKEDRERLLAAESAAIGYPDRTTAKPLSVFEALKKGIVDKKTALTLLQAQESAGGILDPVNSVFLPKDAAMKGKLIDEEIKRSLNQQPECYIDPDTEKDVTYESLKRRCKTEYDTGLLLLPISGKQDPNKLIFDGVRKPVTAQQLLDCGVLDKPTFNQLLTEEKTIPEVSKDKKISLKGTGAIAAVIAGDHGKMSFAEAKKQGLIPTDSANKLLEAQAATGHIIDPETNTKLTVEEACIKGVVAKEDRERLLAAESAAIGYPDRTTAKPLSVFEALKKGIVDKKTALTLLQAQESAGGILDPVNSVFLPKDAAMKGKLIDEEIKRSLNQQPECYIDPDTEKDVTYESLKRRCKTEYDTGLLLLPISGKQDPNKLIFDGVRKPVTAQQLLDCGVLDKPTFNQLLTKEKTIQDVSKDKKISLKGTGAIAAVIAGDRGKMSFAEAKKQGLIPIDSANKLLEAQAATGHIIDPETNKKLTVEEACIKGVVAKEDRERLLAAESAAIGYPDRTTAKPLSVFEALKKGIVDKKTALTLLQAQESAGGILDPVNSVFLPKDAAMKGKLIDEEIKRSLNQQPECYIDPDTEKDVTYESLKRRCKTEYDTGLLLLPISGKQDPNKLIFDGVRKPVTAQQLLDCGVLDKPTFNQLLTKEKTIQDVSKDKKISLKGTGAIAAVIAGDRGKMSFAEAKKQGLIPIDSANKLLEAQAATGHIIDPETNKKLTVEEACIKGVVAKEDRERLLAAESAAIGYPDRTTAKPLSVFEALKKGIVDKKTALTLLQAQESAGGILDPVNSVFLPKDAAMKGKLIDEEIKRSLNQQPECYIDPDTEKDVTYESLKRRCKTEYDTGLLLLPISGKQDPNKLIFDGVRKPVTAQQLLDCGVLDKPTFNQLLTKEKTIQDISKDKKISLKGTGAIAAVIAGDRGKMSFAEAKKQGLIPIDSANKLLEAQAATGHIIDPETNKKLTVEEACIKGVVAKEDRERLLAAESAAIGYPDRTTAKPLSVFEALKRGIVDKKTALTLLQAQESAGGILDPVNSVFLPKDAAMKGKLIDEEIKRSLNQQPECYIDPDTEKDVTYESLKRRCKTEYDTGLLLLPISGKQDPNKLIFDGVRKPVTAQQLLDCGVLDKPTFNQLLTEEKTIQDISKDKKISLKGTGAIAAVIAGDRGKMSFAEAKKQGLIPIDSANKLLEAQASTGHIIDPETNKKLTVEEACIKGVVAKEDRERLLAAESAAIGYPDRTTAKPLSVFEALKKGIVDKKTALTLLQAQESAGGILDPVNSVFLPKDAAMKGKLIDEEIKRSLNQQPECYIDPDTEKDVTYESLKRRCKTEYDTGLLLLPISGKQDPNKLIFDGVRKPVTAQQLLDCGVLDKPIFNQLLAKEKTIPDVSKDKKISLKGTGAIAAVIAGDRGKMSFAEAKKQGLIPIDSANKLLEAQAATGHIIDPETNKKLTVEEACIKGVVAKEDRERLLAAESAAIGYPDRTTAKPLSVFEALKRGIVDKKTALTLLQAQESAGGILDPVNSVFLPKDAAMKGKLIDEEIKRSLNQQPECYIDPDTEKDVTYESLKRRCKTEYDTGLLLLPISGKQDPNKLIFDGVRKPVTAQQLLDCGVLDKPTFNQLLTEEKNIPEVSKDKKISLKGTGAIAAVIAGDHGKMSFAEAKKQGLIPTDSANKLLEAQAATGHIIDPETNTKLTVEEACIKGVVAKEDRERLLAAESAAIGYPDRTTAKPLSVFEALKKGIVDKKTALTLLQAQESAGGILDPVNSVFLPKDAAMKGKLIDEEIKRSLNQQPECYIDPDTEKDVTYESLKRRCKTEYDTGLLLLPISGKQDPNKLIFDGVRKPVTAQQLLDCGMLDKPTFNQLLTKEKTIQEVSTAKKVSLTGTGVIAAVIAGDRGKMSFAEAKKQGLIPIDSANKLLEAQAATGHIIDPETNKKLTVEEACIKGVVAKEDRERLLAAESAAIGYTDRSTAKPLSVFEALKRGIVDKKTALTLLQAQESAGGILDPVNSVFLPKDAAMKGKLIDEEIKRSLNQQPECYIDPDTEKDVTYESLKRRCKTEYDTGLLLLPISGKKEPTKLFIDSNTIERLEIEEKTVTSVSTTKTVNRKGTGVIATVIAGNQGKMSFSDTKKQHAEGYMDTETDKSAINESSKRRFKTESHSTLLRLPISEQQDSTKLIFDGIRKTVTAQQLLDCGVLDKKTFTLLLEGKKTVSDVSVDKKLYLKGTGSIGGIAAGPLGKMSFTEARNGEIISADSAIFLLEAQAATGYIIDPRTDQKLTVEEAYSKGVIDPHDRSRLSAVEAAALGYQDPNTSKLLTACQAMRKGLIDKDTALRILQAQESVGGILDPFLGVFLPRDIAMGRNIIDKELYNALNSIPDCFLDPNTQHRTNYLSLKRKCKLNPTTGLLLLPAPCNPFTVQGLRGKVSLSDLVDANLLENSDVENLREGKLTIQDIEQRLQSYLRGSTCIAGVYDETSKRVMPIYEAMKEGLLAPGTTLELLEAQAASGFVVDPVKNIHLTVTDALNRGLVGPEFKDKLLSAERAVTGYKLPDSDKVMSVFETMERGLMERGLGIRLLEAQIASGGIIDPIHSHRIDVNVAYKRGYFNAEINQILTDEGDDTKVYCDPHTDEKRTYMELKQCCIADENTGLILLPILDNNDQQHSTQKNTRRKRRVIIVDPDTNREMTVQEALDTGLIDFNTYIELSMQECEWEEIITTSPDGSSRLLIVDRTTGNEYNISELIEQGVIDQSIYEQYTSHRISLNEFAVIIAGKRKGFSKSSLSSSSSSSSSSLLNQGNPGDTVTSAKCSSISTRPQNVEKCITTITTTVSGFSSIVSEEVSTSAETLKHLSSVSVIVNSPDETIGEQEPVGAIFDADNLEKLPILEARNRGIVDSITAQRMLEAQACTGGIVDPSNGQRHGIKEACILGLIDDKLAPLLKSAQKAYVGFENIRVKSKLSAAEAMKEKWLPYEAGQRFMEYQFVTGGLFDPELGCRRSIEDALNIGWLDERTARKLQDTRRHSKNLTCPKTKLKISYKEALDNCLLEETTGVRMLQASSISSRGISSPYSISSAPGSRTCSRSSSRVASRRSSVDLGTPTSSVSKQISSTRYSLSSFSSSSAQ